MSKLEIAKKIIKEYYPQAKCGIFDCPNWIGDPMETIYKNDGLIIDICYQWMYFEVFGLSFEDFTKLTDYYWTLEENNNE